VRLNSRRNPASPFGAREQHMASNDSPRIDDLFIRMVDLHASDIHLKEGNPPIFRVDGKLRRMKSSPLSETQIQELVNEWLSEEQRRELKQRGNIDVAHEFPGGRVRVAIFLQRGRMTLVARLVKSKIPTLQELNLPPQLASLTDYGEGLVLVCGITGAGKSTTLACLLRMMNEKHAVHILTFEDPIEFVHTDDKSIINQREYRLDFKDWSDAIRAGVRADPDVMLIGEMRDHDTFQLGLTAAETGHLVFGTMHTSGAMHTIGRILDLFPPERHKLLRQSLAFNLKAIVCQRLMPSIKPEVRRVPAVEILLVNPPVRKAIEEGDDGKLEDLILVGEKEGMQSWTTSFVNLIKAGLIDKKIAREYAPNKEALEMALKGISFTSSSLG
jgi:twitching motility protein PilT